MFCFAIEIAAIFEAFVGFRFDKDVITKLLPEKPVLLLDMFRLQRHVLLLEVSIPKGPELHLDMPTLHRPVLLLDLSTPTLHRPVLLFDLSTPQGPELHLDKPNTT